MFSSSSKLTSVSTRTLKQLQEETNCAIALRSMHEIGRADEEPRPANDDVGEEIPDDQTAEEEERVVALPAHAFELDGNHRGEDEGVDRQHRERNRHRGKGAGRVAAIGPGELPCGQDEGEARVSTDPIRLGRA